MLHKHLNSKDWMLIIIVLVGIIMVSIVKYVNQKKEEDRQRALIVNKVNIYTDSFWYAQGQDMVEAESMGDMQARSIHISDSAWDTHIDKHISWRTRYREYDSIAHIWSDSLNRFDKTH